MNKSLIRRQSAFDQIAEIAMTNHFFSLYSSYISRNSKTRDEWTAYLKYNIQNGNLKLPNFKRPTSILTGYFNVLKVISEFNNGIKRADVVRKLNVKSLNRVLDRLEYAGFIKLDRKYTHKYFVTNFGLSYLAAVKEQFEI